MASLSLSRFFFAEADGQEAMAGPPVEETDQAIEDHVARDLSPGDPENLTHQQFFQMFTPVGIARQQQYATRSRHDESLRTASIETPERNPLEQPFPGQITQSLL